LGLLLAVAFLGFLHNRLLQPVLPLFILDLGGDATLVGIVVAAFSVPSIVLRPLIGRLVDEWNHHKVFLLGSAGLAISSFAYIVPSLLAIISIRILHGTSWAAFNTAGYAALARLAPPARRGEASGVYDLMPGLAQFVGPALGLAVLGIGGFDGAFVVAGLAGFAGAAIVASGGLRVPSRQAGRAGRTGRAVDRLLEPGAILPMVLELLFTSSFALYVVYPPVFAAGAGIPISDLTIYYPIYGGTLVGARFLLRGLMDRLDRRRIVVIGATIALLSLVVAAVVPTFAGLTIAGVLFATAASFTSPTLMAVTIDRAQPERIGAAMATYSIGFQMATGVGAAVSGLVIDRIGYPAPYWLGVATQLAVLAVVAMAWRPGSTDGARR
jgi:predicted MFS family arabinose efflux permease